jgi:glycine cleavage system transcriptional repressor
MSCEYIVAAVGGNRPGVVAELTRLIYLAGIKIENSNMTLLADHFTLMIHIRSEEAGAPAALAEKLGDLEREKGIRAALFPAEPQREGEAEARARYVMRVRGSDRSGIVFKTSQFLAERGVNILDMKTWTERGPGREQSRFRMQTLIEVPRSMDGEELRSDLETLASELQESITLTRATQPG